MGVMLYIILHTKLPCLILLRCPLAIYHHRSYPLYYTLLVHLS